MKSTVVEPVDEMCPGSSVPEEMGESQVYSVNPWAVAVESKIMKNAVTEAVLQRLRGWISSPSRSDLLTAFIIKEALE
ncbi:MAG: hypothetical protein ABEJ02_02970 [Candidatus Paceibacteria bacterium]